MDHHIDELLDRFCHGASTAGIFTDFDGTLSPIVADPALAVPVRGVPDLLGALAQRYAVVAVISGRPVSFLAPHLPPAVVVVGLYGLEVRRDGDVEIDPAAERWRPIVTAAVERSRQEAPPPVVVEPKDLSLTLHYRAAPDLEDRVVALAAEIAAETGLVARPAKRSVELHPAIEADKGTALTALARELSAACYLGDDLGDLAAFAALDDLSARGLDTFKVAVHSVEAPAALLDAADLTVDNPVGAADLLHTLLQRTTLDPRASRPTPGPDVS